MKQALSLVVGTAAVITLGLLPNMAEAQGPPPDPARRAELVRRFDADGDGVLSPAEIEAARAARNGRAATPASVGGKSEHTSSGAEAAAVGNDQVIEQLFRRFDSDGNGKLNFAEMDALRAFMKTQSSRDTRADGTAAPSIEEGETVPHHPPHKAGGDGHE